MRRAAPPLLLLAPSLLVAVTLLRWTVAAGGSSIPATRCNPAGHICEGRCPTLPSAAKLPPRWGEEEGLCLKDSETGVCVCWLPNPPHASSGELQHFQTLFKCEVLANGTSRHVMCLPPPICFPPEAPGLSCMIVLQCPCRAPADRAGRLGRRWHPVDGLIMRSKTPVPALAPGSKEGITENPSASQGDVREFSVKHLLFLLAFVVAPLLCWCLLTFFHEGKCRKKRPSAESEPMRTERVEEVTSSSEEAPPQGPCVTAPPLPTAPKFESPPPYGHALHDPGESCPLAADCGPPPSYEEAVRDHGWRVPEHPRIQDV